MEIWIALAATTVLAGSIWQAALEIGRHLRAMSFLGAHNSIVREELRRIRDAVPVWRPLKRRRERRMARQEAFSTLSPDETALARDYDRHAWGWSLVVVGTLVATVSAWVQVVVGA
jgi:hypothetical protein